MNYRGIHLIEELLVTLLLVLEVIVLISGFFRLSDEDITVALVVENDLLNGVVGLEQAFFVRELSNVVGCLRVVRGELLVDGLVFLLLSEVLLVVAELVGLHVE